VIYEWQLPFTLTCDGHTIDFNEVDGGGDAVYPRYQLAVELCDVGWDTRVTKDNIPADNGSLLRKRYATGVEAKLVVDMLETFDEPACGSTLTDMMDNLRLLLWRLLTVTDDSGRLTWTPTGHNSRILDAVKLLDLPRPQLIDNVRTRQEFTIDSPFPYAIDLTQTEQVINNTTGSIVMTGTADFKPVMRVYSFSAWNVLHNDLSALVSFDPGRVGAGGLSGTYIEVDFFKNTAFVDGSGADAMCGIEIEFNDFFPLVPGANSITTDVDARFLVNNAWA
jgi:hypothetical protein